jgi:hypothetical protein
MVTLIISLVVLYIIFMSFFIYINIINTINSNITLALIEKKINEMNAILQDRDNFE